MADNKQIICAVLGFLERYASGLNDDQAEALEVAKQCLETAFDYDPQTDSTICSVPYQLEEIFTAGLSHLQQQGDKASSSSKRPIVKQATDEEKKEAEELKIKGNNLIKENKFAEAVESYSEAITKDPSNAVFYCNRAAARSKINEHEAALRDCEQALNLEPGYGKAFGRKGLAHSALNQHTQARDCFKKALQLDANNQSYQQNLEIAEQKIRETGGPAAGNPFANMGGGGGMPGLGGMDLNAMFNNPALMNMASTMMANPQMQNFISSMIQGASGGQQGAEGAPDVNNLLQAGQQMAQQMQSQNPDLVNQLRSQMQTDTQNPSDENPDRPPPEQ